MRAYRELGPGGTDRDRAAVLSSPGHQARQTEPTRGSTESHLTMPVAPGCGHSGSTGLSLVKSDTVCLVTTQFYTSYDTCYEPGPVPPRSVSIQHYSTELSQPQGEGANHYYHHMLQM